MPSSAVTAANSSVASTDTLCVLSLQLSKTTRSVNKIDRNDSAGNAASQPHVKTTPLLTATCVGSTFVSLIGTKISISALP